MRAAVAQSATGFDKFVRSKFGRMSAANAPEGPKPGMVSDNPSPPATSKEPANGGLFLWRGLGGRGKSTLGHA